MLKRLIRILKHSWHGDLADHKAVSPTVLQRLQQLIRASELRHSGEIRICVEARLPLSYLARDASTAVITRQRALAMFSKLRVWDTEDNNGVLIYLLLAEHTIELVADRGLNPFVNSQHWAKMVSQMSKAFQQHQFEAGLTEAVAGVSALLQQYFPLAPDEANPNELPDSPVLL